MPDQKSLKQQAEEAAELAKQVGGETFEAFKNSGAGKEVFGEDGKFGDDDKERLKADAGTAAQKVKDTVLGDDGKFGDDDKERLKSQAEEIGSQAKDAFDQLVHKE